jgi:NhaA family Na+:H+ antiporter
MNISLTPLLSKLYKWVAIVLVRKYPKEMHVRNLFGLSLLASIGFTMLFFVPTLAFKNEIYITQAKIGIFTASIIGGVLGYFI